LYNFVDVGVLACHRLFHGEDHKLRMTTRVREGNVLYAAPAAAIGCHAGFGMLSEINQCLII
jgi:hypothetical protein